MRLKIVENKSGMTQYVAEELIKRLEANPHLNLGLATGSTYIDVYAELVRAYEAGRVSFCHVQTFNLDEYMDISSDHPETFQNFMDRHLFSHIDISRANTHFPPIDEHADYAAYDELIASKGGIDIQLLGIGTNGHIAFNEPGTSFDTKTHLIHLTEATREANKRFFNSIDAVPCRAVTMGIDTIMQSEEIIVAASGSKKAEAVRAMLKGPLQEDVPASVLQLHDNVTVVIDREAAHLLE